VPARLRPAPLRRCHAGAAVASPAIMTVLLLVMLYLMIWKPGL
jgi:hypothetical protein